MTLPRSPSALAVALLLASVPFASAGEAAYRRAADYSARGNGHAVLVMLDGKIVFEQYDNGHSADRPHRLASGTKSFWGVAAACAVQDGLLSLDEKVADTIPEWKADPRKAKVSVRHLLSLTSGIDPGAIGAIPTYADALKSPAGHEPGTKFAYGPVPYQIFGEVLRRKLADRKETPLDYLKRRVLDPIGLRVGLWRHGADGQPHLPSGALLTAREWAKFGELVRHGGTWQGKELVPAKQLAQCFRGSKVKPDYGLTFWLPPKARNASKQIPADTVMAAGAGKQRLYILPSRKLVVVRFGETLGRKFEDDEFLRLLLADADVSAGDDGPRVRDFALKDTSGKVQRAAQWRDRKAVVLLYLGTECPVSNGYAPEYVRLAEMFGPRGVAFVGIHPDPAVTADDAAAHAKEYRLPFPILLDPTQSVARQAGVTTTPEAVVVTPDGRVRYRGRIDDRYSLDGKRRLEARRRDLELALEAVLAGKQPSEPTTKPFGCPLPPPAKQP